MTKQLITISDNAAKRIKEIIIIIISASIIVEREREFLEKSTL